MSANDFASTAPNIGSAPSFTNHQSPIKSNQPKNYSNIHSEKSMDIFVPANLKDMSNTSTPKRPRRNTTIDSPTSIKQPRTDSSSPRSSINYSHSISSVNLIYSKNSPKSVKKFSNDSNINIKEIANFNRELANSLDINRLKDLYDKEEVPFIDLKYLIDNDDICRINSDEKVPNRDPSEVILLKHDVPRVSMDQHKQMKFFVHTIYEAITNTREINQYYPNSVNFGGNEGVSNFNFPQMQTEMDIWLSTLNECVKIIGSKTKPVALIILVIQRELKKIFRQLIMALDAQKDQITQIQHQNTSYNRQNKYASDSTKAQPSSPKTSSIDQSKSQSKINTSATQDSLANITKLPPIVGVLKRDIQTLEERVTQLKLELIDAQSEVKQKELHCDKLLDVNNTLRETITNQERKISAMSNKSDHISASGLGQVPDAAQIVWGELSSFARDMTKALKKVNMDLLLPQSNAEISQPKLGLASASSPSTTFKAKAARRKSYASTVQNNLLFDFDIYSLANQTQQPAKEPTKMAPTPTMAAPPPQRPDRPTVAFPKAPTGGSDAFPKADTGSKVSFPPAGGSDGGDAFPKAGATMVPPSNNGGGDAFPRAGATMVRPSSNGGGDAFPRAGPSMVPPSSSGAPDAFPKAGATMVPPSNSGGADAFPRAGATMVRPSSNGESDAFPRANTGGGDSFPKANVVFPPANSGGGDAFPKAGATMVPPSSNGGGDAFPRAGATMVPPSSNGGGDAFPRAGATMVRPSNNGGGDSFPKANAAFPPANSGGGDAFPRAGATMVPPSSNGGGDAFPRAGATMVRPSNNGGSDAFPRANAGGSDAFPKAGPMLNATPAPHFGGLGGGGGGGLSVVASKPSPSAMNVPLNKNAASPFQKKVRAPTRADKKLHFTNFFPAMCNFTETCSGGLLSKPPSSIYTQLESELRQFLVTIFQKYKERMTYVRGEIEKMNDKFNTQLAHMKERSSHRSKWLRVLFRFDDFIILPKDVKVTDDYQVVMFTEVAKAMVAKMKPQESEEFAKMLTFDGPNSDSNVQQNNASSEKVASKQNDSMTVRPTNASDALFDAFPPTLVESLIDFIAYVNKSAKSDISVDMFRRFFNADLPFTHFIFFCKFYLLSLSLSTNEENAIQLRVNTLSQLFNKYGYNTTLPEELRLQLEEQYCQTLPSFVVFAMSLYEHVIKKLSQHVENEMNSGNSKTSSSPKGSGVNFNARMKGGGSLGKQQFLLNYLKDSVINYVEPEKPKMKDDNEEEEKEEVEKKKEEKVPPKPVNPAEKEAENKNAVEYMKAIAGSAKDLSFVEVAVEMFNYIIPLENSLEDFNPQNEELLVYMSTFGEKPKKGKKGKDKNKRILEPIKPGELLTK